MNDMIFEKMALIKKIAYHVGLIEISCIILLFLGFSYNISAQIYPASPSNWLYPDGNSEGTRHGHKASFKQEIDSFAVKWSTDKISGDVKPLIGNIINNGKILSRFLYAPNEMTAVVVGKLF